jgi:hypothetical protein
MILGQEILTKKLAVGQEILTKKLAVGQEIFTKTLLPWKQPQYYLID